MAAELPQPGVEVVQTFRTVSPTVVTPTLIGSIVGACKQIVSAVVASASGGNQINADAQVVLPAFFNAKAATGSPPQYTMVLGSLKFSVDHHPTVTVAFAAGATSPATVVDLVNKALVAAEESSAIAETVGTNSWRLRTLGASDFERIDIDATSTAGVLSVFGLETTDSFVGASTYSNYQLSIPEPNFPDPRNNIDELSIETDTIRSFLAVSGGSALFELLRTQTLLRKGGATTVLDDGNGDSFSPFLHATGQDFTSATTVPSAATVTGAAAPTYGSLDGKTLIISDGRAPKEITFDAPADEAAVASQIQAAFSATNGLTCVTDGSDKLVITSTRKREDGTTDCKGEDSALVFYGGSALQPTNFLDPGPSATVKIGRVTGHPYKVSPGDEVYIDGTYVAKVVQVAPNGNNDVLKVDRQLPLTFTGTTFYIIAKGAKPIGGGGAVDRPAPDLIVSSTGTATFKLGVLRDTTGSIVESVTTTALISAKASMYVSYHALRLDVTQSAANPGLLRFDDTIQLTSELEPISSANPLALGLYLALLNAPNTQVTGLGVDAVSADQPYGTVDAFTRAAEYLEAYEVYGLAPLTHSSEVGQVFKSHVDGMSAPASKGERIVLINPEKPTNKLDTLVASGTDGNGIGSTHLQFDTGIANLSALLLAQGIDPTGTIAVSKRLFLDIASDSKHYSVESISGSIVTIRTTFTPDENADGFYSTAVLPSNLIEEAFALRIRGAALVTSNGDPDKNAIADTYAALGQTYLDRRVWMVVPDKCAATLEGIEQIIEGFYMCAANVGAISQQPPQQSFTNFPITGFTRVIGSNDYFTKKQMDRMAGGGCYIMMQEAANAPLMSRMALTTDLTSIETRTDSITKVVDFSAKFYRRGLKNFIGRFNITQGFLDSLGHVLEGLSDYLKGNGVLIGAFVNNIIQDEKAPDTVLVDITLDVPYPCNYIRVTLVI